MTDFQGPNQQQDPGFEKRLLLAVILTFVVVTAVQFLMPKRPQPQQPPAAQQQQQPQNAQTPTASAAAPATAQQALETTSAPLVPVATRQAQSESETVIENDLYRITFTNKGGQVKSWILKKYTDDHRKPLDLVHPIAAPQYGYPLSLWVYDQPLRDKLKGVLYEASATGEQKAPASVTFEYADGETQVRKTYSFDHSYVLKIETSVTHKGATIPAYPMWPAGFGDQTVPVAYNYSHIERMLTDGEVKRQLPVEGGFLSKKTWVVGGDTVPGPFYWAGATDQYFAAIFMPDDPQSAALVTQHHSIKIPADLNKPDPNQTIDVSVLGAAVGNPNGNTSLRLFVGPKEVEVVEGIRASAGPQNTMAGPDLGTLVDWGFFGIIARPLFLWLKWTHDHWIANWGWSIVILTIIINVALLPLRIASMKSSLRMQKLQPQIKSIQEKYKKYAFNDPRKMEMNKEMQALYKKEGVNPLSGCVPLLLQLPFLFAFYTMLTTALEMRHAPWLWVQDLSSPDPWHILPVVIVVTMFMSQRITPMAGMDAVQQKMMLVMMPLMMGVITWTLSAGLCVYWAVGNVLTWLQQFIMNRTPFGREMLAHAQKAASRKHPK